MPSRVMLTDEDSSLKVVFGELKLQQRVHLVGALGHQVARVAVGGVGDGLVQLV